MGTTLPWQVRGEALARHRQALAERADGDGWAAELSADATLPIAEKNIEAYTIMNRRANSVYAAPNALD